MIHENQEIHVPLLPQDLLQPTAVGHFTVDRAKTLVQTSVVETYKVPGERNVQITAKSFIAQRKKTLKSMTSAPLCSYKA